MKNMLKKLKRFCRSVLSVSELVLWRVIARHQQNFGSGEIVVIQDCHVGDFMVSLPFSTVPIIPRPLEAPRSNARKFFMFFLLSCYYLQ